MNILVIGKPENMEECRAKFGSSHHYFLTTYFDDISKSQTNIEVIFDFLIANEWEQIQRYEKLEQVSVFFNTATISLSELISKPGIKGHNVFYGFCGLPTFLNRPILEVSVRHSAERDSLGPLCAKLNTDFTMVDDRVGLITPRIICMIINEAYYTVQEGTASRGDIDLAMKLGTNYPYGPFEWCKRIGIKNVYNLLTSVYNDTKDERYKICPLLKKEVYS